MRYEGSHLTTNHERMTNVLQREPPDNQLQANINMLQREPPNKYLVEPNESFSLVHHDARDARQMHTEPYIREPGLFLGKRIAPAQEQLNQYYRQIQNLLFR